MRTLLIAVLAVFLVCNPAVAQSKEDQLLSYVKVSMPSGFSLGESDFKFRDFPRDGGGRMSVAGTMILTTDLLQKMLDPTSAIGYPDWPNLRNEVARRGYSDKGEFLRAARNFGIGAPRGSTLFEYVVRYPAGWSIPFSGELNYIETVSGIRLSGRLQYEKLEGKLPNEIRERYYVVQQRVAFFDLAERIVAEIQSGRGAFDTALSSVAQHFSAPLLFQSRDDGPLVSIMLSDAEKVTELSNWNVSSNSSGPILNIQLQGSGEVLKRFEYRGTEFKRGEMTAIRIGVRMAQLKSGLSQASVYLAIQPENRQWADIAGSAFPLQPWGNGHARGWVQLVPQNGTINGATNRVAVARNPLDALKPESGTDANNASRTVEKPTTNTEPQDTTLADMEGLWQTSDGKLKINVEDQIGRIVSGGSGRRPNGVDMLIIDQVLGAGRMQARTRFSNGAHVRVELQLDGNRLQFSGGGYEWVWERSQDTGQ